MRVSTEPPSPASPFNYNSGSPMQHISHSSRSFSYQDNSTHDVSNKSAGNLNQNNQFSFLKSLTENENLGQPQQLYQQQQQQQQQQPKNPDVAQDQTEPSVTGQNPGQNRSRSSSRSCDARNVIQATSSTTTTTTTIFSANKTVDMNSVVAQLGVLQPCFPPPPKRRQHRAKNLSSKSEPSLASKRSSTTTTTSPKNILKQYSFTQSYQHFEVDSGVESIESLSPKEMTSSPIYSPAGNADISSSNLQPQNQILSSILSATFGATGSNPANSTSSPNSSVTAGAGPLLTTLLGANNPTAIQVTNTINTQINKPSSTSSTTSTSTTTCVGKKSISIVSINPNDQTISTIENVFEVEAVMDITIDIEQAASMAAYQVTH